MFFEGGYRFFTSHQIEMSFDIARRRRMSDSIQHPKAHKMYVCSPPWRSIAPQHVRCFKGR